MSTDGRPLMAFDGDCGFCATSARLGQKWLDLEHGVTGRTAGFLAQF